MRWFYMQDGKKQEQGPFDKLRMQQLVTEGIITNDTLVRNDNLLGWTTYGHLLDEAQSKTRSQQKPAAPPRPLEGPGACSECGSHYSADALVEYRGQRVCQSCAPLVLKRLGAAASAGLQYAGFWIRFGAKMIDGVVLFVPLMAINLVFIFLIPAMDFSGDYSGEFTPATVAALVLMYFLQIAIPLAYTTFFVGRYAATPGKMALGLKVVMPEGGRVSYARALGRHFAEFLSQITLYIGYIIAGFDDQKRALHDHVAGTRVIIK